MGRGEGERRHVSEYLSIRPRPPTLGNLLVWMSFHCFAVSAPHRVFFWLISESDSVAINHVVSRLRKVGQGYLRSVCASALSPAMHRLVVRPFKVNKTKKTNPSAVQQHTVS